jgi:hypothetical protein
VSPAGTGHELLIILPKQNEGGNWMYGESGSEPSICFWLSADPLELKWIL